MGVDAQEAGSLAVVTQAANSAAGTRIQAAGAHISHTFLILRFLSISYICICFRWADFFLLIWLWRGDTPVSFWFSPSWITRWQHRLRRTLSLNFSNCPVSIYLCLCLLFFVITIFSYGGEIYEIKNIKLTVRIVFKCPTPHCSRCQYALPFQGCVIFHCVAICVSV